MMKRFDDKTDGFEEQVVDLQDADLQEALTDFKSSIHAWSDAAYSRPRAVTRGVQVRSWRLAAGWALGCVLVAGSVSGGLMERSHRAELARIASQQRAAEQLRQLQLQEQAKVTDEALLADVDSAVSRQVPSAMEPLAQMDDDETK
jgi:type VI protein secretion system component VasK